MRFNRDFLQNLIAACILYAVVLVYQGYQYGQGDQTQILPCIWAQDHPDAYAIDHYVQHYLASGVNERTIFHFLLRYLGYDQPWLVWIWHALAGISLILAWINISAIFIKNKALQWFCIGCILTIGFHTSTGSNELYYNSFIPSVPAKALASWAIYFWLKGKYWPWSLLLIVSGFLQPLVGIQVFLFTTVALIINARSRKEDSGIEWKPIFLYLSCNIIWLYLLISNNGSHHDPKTFMDLMEFRLSHHFFASYFGWINLLAGLIFAIICIAFFRGKLKWIFLIIISGCCFYEIGVELLRLPIILYTQWWKTTIWTEAFAFVAILALVERNNIIRNAASKLGLWLPVVLLVAVCSYRLSGFFGSNSDYLFPWNTNLTNEISISRMAGEKTPGDAVFLVPPELTAFRWYSKRSSFVDYKAMIHTEVFLNDWYLRIGEAYKYDLNVKKEGKDFTVWSDSLLATPDAELIATWRGHGITNIISAASSIPGLNYIGGNRAYSIYRIP